MATKTRHSATAKRRAAQPPGKIEAPRPQAGKLHGHPVRAQTGLAHTGGQAAAATGLHHCAGKAAGCRQNSKKTTCCGRLSSSIRFEEDRFFDGFSVDGRNASWRRHSAPAGPSIHRSGMDYGLVVGWDLEGLVCPASKRPILLPPSRPARQQGSHGAGHMEAGRWA